MSLEAKEAQRDKFKMEKGRNGRQSLMSKNKFTMKK
jgi:hypothetical protein